LNKAGFEAYYINEDKPYTADDRCNLLDLDVPNIKAFLALSLSSKIVTAKKSISLILSLVERKNYETAFNEALNKAFESVIALNYQYSGKVVSSSVAPAAIVVTKEVSSEEVKSHPIIQVVKYW
jgi:hypothetical protein